MHYLLFTPKGYLAMLASTEAPATFVHEIEGSLRLHWKTAFDQLDALVEAGHHAALVPVADDPAEEHILPQPSSEPEPEPEQEPDPEDAPAPPAEPSPLEREGISIDVEDDGRYVASRGELSVYGVTEVEAIDNLHALIAEIEANASKPPEPEPFPSLDDEILAGSSRSGEPSSPEILPESGSSSPPDHEPEG